MFRLNSKISRFLFVIWVSLIATPTIATAEHRDACLENQRCKDLSDKARTLSLAGQYDTAVSLYQQAYAIKPQLWLLLNIGRVQQKLGRSDQAIVTYRHLLQMTDKRQLEDHSGLTAQEVATRARDYLKQAEAELEAQRLLKETGTVPPLDVEPPPAALVIATPTAQQPPALQPPLSGTADARPAAVQKPSIKPLYKRWWLWATVGTVIVTTVTVGAAVGASAANREDLERVQIVLNLAKLR